MSTPAHELLKPYSRIIEDCTDGAVIPAGWCTLVVAMLHEIMEALSPYPGMTMTVFTLREKYARLQLYYQITNLSMDGPVDGTLQPIIARAVASAATTCQVCGGWAPPRGKHPRVAVLCEAHDGKSQRLLEADNGEALDSEEGLADEVATAERIASPELSEALREAGQSPQPPAQIREHKLYHLRAVADALGQPADLDEEEFLPQKTETEHEERLAAILRRGEAATWRDLARPDREMLGRLNTLEAQAPHMAAVTALVRRHVLAALHVGLPLSLPPVMLLGEPGVGKSWYLSRLGGILGVPTRTYPMASSTLGEGLQGSHPSWRNANPGLVAKTLMQEAVSNPLILVDEIDKANPGGWNADPYRPFYALLEPAGARSFRDEYYGFEVDASHVMWILAGNSLSPLPDPIRDRLSVIEIPALTRDAIRAVAVSIYREANARMRSHFSPEMSEAVLSRLLDRTPRGIRVAIQDGMIRAAADGRMELVPADIEEPRAPGVQPMGFLRSKD